MIILNISRFLTFNSYFCQFSSFSWFSQNIHDFFTLLLLISVLRPERWTSLCIIMKQKTQLHRALHFPTKSIFMSSMYTLIFYIKFTINEFVDLPKAADAALMREMSASGSMTLRWFGHIFIISSRIKTGSWASRCDEFLRNKRRDFLSHFHGSLTEQP